MSYDGKALIIEHSEILKESSPEENINRMAELAERLVVPAMNMTPEETKFNEMMILGFYKEYLEGHKTTPQFEDIYESVVSHNDDLFDEMAMAEMIARADELGVKDLSEDSREELLLTLSEEWSETYYCNYTVGAGLDYYVQEILDKHRAAYLFDSRDVVYSDSKASSLVRRMPKSIDFLNNDCQNVIMPEMLTFGFTGCGDYINYYPQYTETQLMLTAGKDKDK